MPAPPPIQALIDRYEVHRMAYLRDEANYNEAKVRKDFIEPFFRALNWDIDNNKGFSEAYREVMLEEPIRIRERTQFFDYTFRIGGIRKFILEAKKPAVSIRDNSDAALQLRWYAWNAKLPLSILTNFEEFAVYDCTRKPATNDAASVARIEYFTYKDFPAKWEWIASVFSQDSILKGSFDRYAAETKGKKGTASVDDDILAEIESWRDALARNLANRTSFNVDEINAVVQRTIDRILFLRICEDRGIEVYGALQKLTEGDHVYPRLCEIFRYADEKYNSGLFHFQKEAEISEPPDTISLGATIDDKVLKGIIKRLYYPESPYLFSVIQPAILGHVYEQFLGKVIRLTEGRQAKVEYKPEVKKAGGVFYTPQYIVEYIVKHTVGELLKDKTPREIAKLRIIDPACGSGSFLIGAFQFLLDRHRDWYIENLVPVYIDKKESILDPAVLALLPEPTPRGKKKLAQIELPIYRAGTSGDATRTRSDWRLTTAEKKRILLNNIFGVDIDQQAVEVTKLSLLLKVLEEENEENIEKQLKLFAERALPSLHQNIKCGNSLIGWDIVTPEMPPDEVKRINPFDWSKEFEPVIASGGFDVVIGNPPYVRMESFKEIKDYLKAKYSVYSGRADLYAYFIEKGFALLKKNGMFGIIVANKWIRANYGESVRELLRTKKIDHLIDFRDLEIFKGATTYPCIIIFSNVDSLASVSFTNVTTLDFSSLDHFVESNSIDIERLQLAGPNWILHPKRHQEIIDKVWSKSIPLGEYIGQEIFRGVVTGLNSAFIISEKEREAILNSDPKSEIFIKPMLAGKDIKRYTISHEKRFLIFTYHGAEVPPYSGIIQHLKPYKDELERRATEQKWFELQQPQYAFLDFFNKPKIVYPEICSRPNFSFDDKGYFMNNKCFGIPKADLFFLGLLNSQLMMFFFEIFIPRLRGDFFMPGSSMLVKLPIRTINFSDPLDKVRHDHMVALVTLMLDLNKKLQDARLEQERTMLSRQIEATDAAIDKLVYELYGLTDEEIAIVEGTE